MELNKSLIAAAKQHEEVVGLLNESAEFRVSQGQGPNEPEHFGGSGEETSKGDR